ncbi:MAG: hypothetical protein ACYDHG_09815 [Desulfomonilaceae bacterium]
MIRAIEPRVCTRMQEVGLFNVLEKVLTIVLLSFLFVTAADTLSHAQTVSNNPTPLQSYTQGFTASNPSCVYNSQQGNLLSVGARWGMANCWGSNGPPPIHVCLTSEMGLGFNSFYGFDASLNFVDRNDYGAIASLDVNQFYFRGSNGKVEETRSYGPFDLVKGDSLSGDNTTTIISVNSDFHLGAGLAAHVLKFRPRLQFVDYIQDMTLRNHTQRWYDSGASRYTLWGVGGVMEFNLLPFWSELGGNGIMNSLAQDIRFSATIGTGGTGVRYWSWNAEFNFLKYNTAGLAFADHGTQITAEAGMSMWQILERSPFPEDLGRIDTIMFYLQASAVF